MKITFRLFLSAGFFLAILASSTLFAADDCSNCHEDVKAEIRRSRFVHQLVLTGQCSKCHIAGEIVTAPDKKSSLALEKQQLEQIRWVQAVTGREREHWLRLPADRLSNGLYLKATDGQMRSPLQEVVLPNGGALPQKLDDHQPPMQSGLRVVDVRRGISATANLQWKTDEYTDSIIYYGVGNLKSVKNDHQLTRQHSQVLLSLDADKTYQYQIVSRDLFGNETRSPVLEFSTAKSFWNQDAQYSDDSLFSTNIELQWELYRIKDDYLIVVKSDRPVFLSFGMESKLKNQRSAERQVATAGEFSHPILKSPFDTNITVCKTCHQGLRDEYSHPVNVRPRKGMIIPNEYPVLPDGKISCISCHANHASNNEYLLIKPGKAELCRGCHKDY